jgi:SNF2 family DNA or RNA helicase
VAKGTVEEKIRLLHAKKRSLADMALEDAELGASLTREELVDLLS